jgi:osmoprotectant transport system substrate-binding protein
MIKHLRTLALTLALTALAGTGTAQAQITVGGKASTAQLLLAAMTTQYLDAQGYDVDKRVGMGSTILRRAQLKGQVDLSWESVGTALSVYHNVADGAGMSADAAYAKVKALDAEKDLVWLEPTDANDAAALAMRETDAEAKGIATLRDLVEMQKTKGGLSLGVTSEWAGRPDGLLAFQDHHDLRWPRDELRRMPSGRVYRALKDGEIDVGVVFTGDGRLSAFDLRVLVDDTGVFPNAAITPVVRTDTLDKHPDLATHLNTLGGTLHGDTMRRLSKMVHVANETVADVAAMYLTEQGLI